MQQCADTYAEEKQAGSRKRQCLGRVWKAPLASSHASSALQCASLKARPAIVLLWMRSQDPETLRIFLKLNSWDLNPQMLYWVCICYRWILSPVCSVATLCLLPGRREGFSEFKPPLSLGLAASAIYLKSPFPKDLIWTSLHMPWDTQMGFSWFYRVVSCYLVREPMQTYPIHTWAPAVGWLHPAEWEKS